jgi:SPP1 family predicted phage head-tail adaptor
MRTRTSDYNTPIAIQSQTTSQDAAGQELQEWTTVLCCWANVDFQRSQLIYSTAEFVGKNTYRVSIRWQYQVVIQPNMRVVYTDPFTRITHTLEIQSVLNPNRANKEILLICYSLDEDA